MIIWHANDFCSRSKQTRWDFRREISDTDHQKCAVENHRYSYKIRGQHNESQGALLFWGHIAQFIRPYDWRELAEDCHSRGRHQDL